MTPMRFFILNGVVLLLLVIYILRKRPKSSFRLRMTRLRGGTLAPDVSSSDLGLGGQPPREKNLNTLFNYNGHTWDAYEVLGLPAGSPQNKIDEDYRSTVDKQQVATSRYFLKATYQAIRIQ